MIHTRTTNQALGTKKTQSARKGVGFRFRLGGERPLTELWRTDFRGRGPLL